MLFLARPGKDTGKRKWPRSGILLFLSRNAYDGSKNRFFILDSFLKFGVLQWYLHDYTELCEIG